MSVAVPSDLVSQRPAFYGSALTFLPEPSAQMPASVLLRPASAPTLSAAPSTQPEVLRDLDRLDDFPMLSETTVRAVALVNNPDASLAEVANLIRSDPVIATAVLRRANTWTYGGGRVINNIQQAILRVGLLECGKLLCMMGTRAAFGRHPRAVQERCDAVHRHSLFVAYLAGEINRTAGFGFNGVEFTAGLLHDIGRVILFTKCPGTHPAPASASGDEALALERAKFGIDHCELGYRFAERNSLPEPLLRAILNHHRPAEELFQPDLVALVAVANRIANYAQSEHNISGYDPSACPVFAVMARRLNSQRAEAFARSLSGMVVRAIRSTRATLKSFD